MKKRKKKKRLASKKLKVNKLKFFIMDVNRERGATWCSGPLNVEWSDDGKKIFRI